MPINNYIATWKYITSKFNGTWYSTKIVLMLRLTETKDVTFAFICLVTINKMRYLENLSVDEREFLKKFEISCFLCFSYMQVTR